MPLLQTTHSDRMAPKTTRKNTTDRVHPYDSERPEQRHATVLTDMFLNTKSLCSVTAHQTERSEPESLVLQARHRTDSEGLSHLSGSGAGRPSNHRRATQAACTSAHPGYETGIMTPTLLDNALDRNHLS